jgi:hypothetical protein
MGFNTWSRDQENGAATRSGSLGSLFVLQKSLVVGLAVSMFIWYIMNVYDESKMYRNNIEYKMAFVR